MSPAGSSQGLVITQTRLSGGNLIISWTGGGPPFVVQAQPNFNASSAWTALLTTCDRTATVPVVGRCAGPSGTFNLFDRDFIFVPSTNQLAATVTLNPDGCNAGCGGVLIFQDKVDLRITAIAADGCSIVSRVLCAAAIYECDFLKFEFP